MTRFFSAVLLLALGLTFSCNASKQATTAVDTRIPNYEAFGSEPFWNAKVYDDQIVVSMMSDEPMVFPAATAQTRGGYTVFESSYKKKGTTHNVRIAFSDKACTDGMSDVKYSKSVRFTIDGENLEGCGKVGGM